MQTILVNISVILFGYLVGSIPFAFIVGRAKGVDMTKKARNGARGASLTWRKVGKIYGVIVGVMDISKGFASVIIAETFSGNPLVVVLAGLAAIIGHDWSLYMRFTGGKGAATTAGNLFYLLPIEFVISFFVILLPLYFTRKKEHFIFPGTKKQFKTSNFFSGIFFSVIFVVALLREKAFILSFSPIIYSIPMFLKDCEIKHEMKKGKK